MSCSIGAPSRAGRRRASARRRVFLLRTLHLAGGRQDRVDRLDGADGLPTPAGPFFVELRARIERAEAGDEQVREELVIVLADPGVAAVEGLGLHALELRGDGLRVVGLG